MAPVAYIALGSNLGDSGTLIRQAFERLALLSRGPILRSSLWRSSPVDCPPGSADFVNAVAAIEPQAPSPEVLLAELQNIERDFGRQPKTILNEARPLDLDLIAWGGEIRNSPALILPHPRAHLRRFVLEPMAEIAPEIILPGQQKTVRELRATLRTDEVIERI